MCQSFSAAFLLLCVFCSNQIVAAPFWDASQIANSSFGRIELKDKEGKVYASVNNNVVKSMLAAKVRIEEAAGYIRPTFWIDAEDQPNAFATYNNGQPIIAINIGMLRILDEDEEAYAALIGHEIAHLYLGHNEKYAQRNGLKQASSYVLGFALGLAGVSAGGTIADLTTTAISTVYSRDDERDADTEGMKYMLKAGYDPYGAVHMQEKLASASGFSIPFLSSHPSGSERIKNMKQMVEVAKSKPSTAPIENGSSNNLAANQERPASKSNTTNDDKPKTDLPVPQKLRELKQLLTDGVITKEDYNKKRKQLVEKL